MSNATLRFRINGGAGLQAFEKLLNREVKINEGKHIETLIKQGGGREQ